VKNFCCGPVKAFDCGLLSPLVHDGENLFRHSHLHGGLSIGGAVVFAL